MLKGLANGLIEVSRKVDVLDEKIMRSDLIKTVRRIEDLEKEMEILKAKECVLMEKLNIEKIIINEEGIELA